MNKTVLAFTAVVLLAALAAVGQAILMQQSSAPSKIASPNVSSADAQKVKTSIHRIPPVIANLKLPEGTWVRIDSVITTVEIEPKEASMLIDHVAQDTLQFMQTLSLNDLEGSQSLSNVRQDLLERVQIRSKGQIKAFIITSLVVQ